MNKLSNKLASLVFSGVALLSTQVANANDDHSAHAGHDHHAHHGHGVQDGQSALVKSPITNPSLSGTVDFNGKSVKDSDFQGKKRLIFFGFTNCPSVCPLGMATLSQAMGQIEGKHGKDAFKDSAVLLVSTDPARDTPAQMKKWLSHFNDNIVGITGDQKRMDEIAKNYRADQMGHHSPYLYIMDEAGKFQALVNTQNGADAVFKAIEKHHFSGAKAQAAKQDQAHDHHHHHGM